MKRGDVWFTSHLGEILASLYGLRGEEWDAALIRVGLAFGLKPSAWVPGE